MVNLQIVLNIVGWGGMQVVIDRFPLDRRLMFKQSFQRPESGLVSTPWLSRVQNQHHLTKKKKIAEISQMKMKNHIAYHCLYF